MRFVLVIIMTILGGCGAPSGVFTSFQAQRLGGNLFIDVDDRGYEHVVLDGAITPETSYVFQSLLQLGTMEGLVITQSPGGDLLAAHQIGRAIQANDMNTLVVVSCISACVDIFMAGKLREMTQIAELGVHTPSNPELAYKLHTDYWTDLGFEGFNELVYDIGNNKLGIITAQNALKMGLATSIVENTN